ncbi:MAG: hypothetical protein DRP66_07560 [Planctomycetota bacterium]|nr:MAG: hypothetical protein DRP66_07560 [Planctomycetota bacterium]
MKQQEFDAVNNDGQMRLLDDLQGLLEKQIEMARKGNLRRVEALAAQADSIVAGIVQTRVLQQPEFDDRREHLTKLYKKLELVLAAGKDAVGRQLRRVGSGRKTLQAYRKYG